MCGWRASASAKPEPAVMESRTFSSTALNFLFVVSVASAVRMRTRCRPPPSMAESWPVKSTRVARLTPLDSRLNVCRKASAMGPMARPARKSLPAVAARTESTTRPCSRKRSTRSAAFSASARPRHKVPARSATSYSNTCHGLPASPLVLVRDDGHDFLERRVPLHGLPESGLPEGDHPVVEGGLADRVAVDAVEHEPPDLRR